jgi:broad specificity phosphatase PhoE
MHVYFVRHGETDLNIRRLHQSPSTPLNERGFDQARTVGELLRPMNPDLLISSSYVRAAQTARMIGLSLGVTPIYKDLFREIERPSLLGGRSLYDIRTLWYLGLTALNRNNPKWRYKDAENFSDIYTRVQKSLEYIESVIEEHDSIVIVSHSAYIMLMILYMCHGQKLTVRELVATLLNIRQMRNCNVAHVEYLGPTIQGTCSWILRPWSR